MKSHISRFTPADTQAAFGDFATLVYRYQVLVDRREPTRDEQIAFATWLSNNTLVPTYGSPPKDWSRLSELLTSGSVTGGAVITGAVDSPIGYLLLLGTVSVYLEVAKPTLAAVGRGLASAIDSYFERHLFMPEEGSGSPGPEVTAGHRADRRDQEEKPHEDRG